MAHEIGFADGRDLLSSAARGPEAASLIARMAASLGRDLHALEATDPAMVRQMQVACNVCGQKRRCAHELAMGSARETFPEFCPNANVLRP